MTVVDIIALSIIGIVLILGAICAVKKFFALPVEKRKELIINWLTGAVVTAQNLITDKTDEANKAKFDQVMNQFKKNAPLTYKIFIKFTKGLNLEDLIEEALENIKNTEF